MEIPIFTRLSHLVTFFFVIIAIIVAGCENNNGGGASGAFGAGILNGWSETGNRPKFKLVTGISTGALTAPFAFLGSEYDQAIKAGYTSVTTEDVAKQRSILSAFTNESLADNAPLLGLIDVNIDEKILKSSGSGTC